MNEHEDHVRRDLEEPPEVLDSMEGDPIDFWEQKQRELITSTVDYNLGTLSDLIQGQTIELSPEFQRRLRWSAERQSLLIESFLMNVPVPPIFLNEDEYGRYSIIDGKQRLTAIAEFMSDHLVLRGLRVFGDLNGLRFSRMPRNLQSALRTRPTLRTVIILRQSDQDIKTLVFHRLNTGGVTLNAQEIRNNAFPGPFNTRIQFLSTRPEFHRLLHIVNKERSAIYREMRDAEFVLRFLTFENTWATFAGGMERHMDAYMADNQNMSDTLLNGAESRFRLALAKVEAAFGQHAFQRWQPERQQWRKPVLASLYDAQMFGTQAFHPESLEVKRPRLIQGMQAMFTEPDFRRSIDAATNTPSYFRYRIEKTRSMIEEALE